MIVRVRRRGERPYVMLETATLRMKQLSFKARGLWAMCMSYPDNWEFRLRHLVTMSERDGESALRSALEELKAVGLVRYDQERCGDGTMGVGRWTIYENPLLNALEPDCKNRDPVNSPDSPEGGYPHADKPDADNRSLRSKEKARSNELNKKGRQAETKTLDKGGDGVPAVDGCGYAAVALPSGARPLTGVLPAAAASFEDRSGLLEELIARGVDGPVAAELVAQAEPEHVRAMLERGAQEAEGPGWYVRAIREGYHPIRRGASSTSSAARPRLRWDQVLRRLEERGVDASQWEGHFEIVARDDSGEPLFAELEVDVPPREELVG